MSMCCEKKIIPARKQSFYKFRWVQVLVFFKENYINSNKLWKAADNSRVGDILKNETMTEIYNEK